MTRPHKRVGIEEVAKAASVSITTVSHALSGRGQVAAATRERVEEVARQLGYSPNRMASGLRTRRSNIIALLADDVSSTPFATRIVLGAQQAAAEMDQLLLVVNSNDDDGIESRQIAALSSAQVDGIIYARILDETGSASIGAAVNRVPSVMLDAVDESGRMPSAIADDVQIGRLATQTLIEAGHRHIAHLTVDSDRRGVASRVAGYREAMHAAQLTPLVVTGGGEPASAQAGAKAYRRLRESGADEVTGVFVFNDPMSMGVYQAAFQNGQAVPHDLSIVSVDDFEPIAAGLMPGLTTVSLPQFELGRWGVQTLLQLLDGDATPNKPVQLPGHLVTRDSIRCLTQP